MEGGIKKFEGNMRSLERCVRRFKRHDEDAGKHKCLNYYYWGI